MNAVSRARPTPLGGPAAGRGRGPGAAAGRAGARQPIGRLVTAEEVAHAIVYLASPLSSSTTGTLLPVDGGMLGVRLPH